MDIISTTKRWIVLHLKVNDIQHSTVTGLKYFDQDLTAQSQNEGDKQVIT